MRVTDSLDEEPFKSTSSTTISSLLNLTDFQTDPPSKFGVPHDTWRTNQLAALEQVSDSLALDRRPAMFLELPTGSGKSGIPTALGQFSSVLVFVESHALLDQYAREYGFKVVKGMASYDCVLPKKVESYKAKFGRSPRASECHFEKMTDCPVHDQCPYIVAREEMLASRRAACTYAFGLLSYNVRARPGIGFWDEAHKAPDAILSMTSFEVNASFIRNYTLPDFPLRFGSGLMEKSHTDKLRDWVSACVPILSNPPGSLFLEEQSEWVGAYEKVHRLLAMLYSTVPLYYDYSPTGHRFTVRSGGRVIEKTEPGFVLRPLTASAFSENLKGARSQQVLMSATIGEPDPLALELGFDNFMFHTYQHPVPADRRPVFDLKFPRMVYDALKKKPFLLQLQGAAIAAALAKFPAEWRGVMLAHSYDRVASLRKALGNTDLASRLFPFDRGTPIGERVKQFIEDRTPGMIATDVYAGWGTGVNLSWDVGRFMVVASVNFGPLSDDFVKVRNKVIPHAEDFNWSQIYIGVVQAAGRVMRGEQNEDGSYLLNVAFLADGSASTGSALRHYPAWFRESITTL